MRKLFTFLLAVTFVTLGNFSVEAQSYYKNYLVNQDFDGLEVFPDGWTGNAGTTALLGYGGASIVVGNGVVTATGGSSGSRGADAVFSSTASNEEMAAEATTWFVETDWIITSSNVGNKNATGILFAGPNSTGLTSDDPLNESYLDAIFCLYACGSSGVLHYWNMDLLGTIPDTSEGAEEGATIDQGGVFTTGHYPSFRRAGTDAATCDANNASTQTTVTYAAGKTYRIVAELDFTTKRVVSLTITEKDAPENTATILDQPFISDQVTELDRVGVTNTRSSSAGNGGDANLNVSIDNFQVYYMKESIGQGNVVVNYEDQTGGLIKSVRHENLEAGLLYQTPNSDKVSFTENGIYYAYDALMSAATTDVLVVKDIDNIVTLKFKGSTAAVDKAFVWTGAIDDNWDQLTNNFTLDGVAASFQAENGAIFSDENSINKEVNVSEIFDLGLSDVQITAPGYTLFGTGRLESTGALIIEKDAKLDVETRMAEGIFFTGDTLTIQRATVINYTDPDGVSAGIDMASGSKLKLESSFDKPIVGSGTLTVVNVPSNSMVLTSSITGFSELNYVLTRKGGFSGYTYNSQVNRMNSVFEGPINVTTTVEGDSTLFGTTISNPTAHINLGEHVYMVHSSNVSGTVNREIGALSGAATSALAGPLVSGDTRILNYNIGGLNTDATFAGSILLFDNQRNEETGLPSRIYMNINKVGTGTWTVTGQSPRYYGNFKVQGGTLALGGVLGGGDDVASTVAMEVEAGATIKGLNCEFTGSQFDVYGTYSGSMTVDLGGGDVTFLDATTKMEVWRPNAGEYDQLVIKGGAFVLSKNTAENTLAIDVKYMPNEAVTIPLFLADDGGIMGEFDAITVSYNGGAAEDITANNVGDPGFSWDNTMMELSWVPDGRDLGEDPGPWTSIDSETVVKDELSSTYYDFTGRILPVDSKGLMIKKTVYTDGSVSTKKVFIK